MSRAAKNSAAPQEIQGEGRLGVLDVSSAFGLLLSKAAPRLNRPELEAIVELSCAAVEHAERASAVASGLACLVAHDGGQEDPGAGNFQSSDDVSGLLLHFADVFQQVGALVRLGQDAQCLLNERGGAE